MKERKALGTVVETTTTQRRIAVDTSKQTILDALRLSTHVVLNGWVEKMLSLPGLEYLLIGKRVKGEFVDVSRIMPGDSPSDNWELYVFEGGGRGWGGPGVYHLQVVHKSEVIGGRVFKVGGAEAITSAEGGLEDADAALGRTFKRFELLEGSKIASALEKKFSLDGSGGSEDMKPEDYRAILEGVKAMQPAPVAPPPDTTGPILMKMFEMAEGRAQASELRNQTLLTTLLERRDKPDPSMTIIPSIVEGLKSLGPRVLGPAMSTIVERFFPMAAPPDGGWTVEKAMGLVQAASPMVQQLIDAFVTFVARGNGPAPATVLPNHPVPLAGPAAPVSLPAATAEDHMRQPGPPTEAELAAMRAHTQTVEMLKAYLAAGDFENAYECMDAAPTFEQWTQRLDPARPAQVYAPFLMTVLGYPLVEAVAIVERFYQILLREDEDSRRAAPPAQGAPESAEDAG